MKIHEYQAKELFQKFGVPIPQGKVAFTAAEARKVAEELGGDTFVVKAQIHAGGRGKGGGVKLTKSPEEAEKIAAEMIGMNLVTHQTGPEGKEVKKVLVEQGLGIDRELYLSMVIDRERSCPVIMASEAGGMDIEEVAATTPEKILKEFIDPVIEVKPFVGRKLAYGLNLTGGQIKEAVALISRLYKLFVEKDCSLVEINPLIVTTEGNLLALDAKINIDDSGLFRQKDVAEYRDIDEEEPLEVDASKYSLNYIKLEGNVGCMVNGAGLAMATMDIIKLSGGSPANFLDVGGGASAEQVENAFRILLSDKNVKGVLINIFGGILRCDRLANGIVQAARNVQIEVPIVIRMEGTNVEEGRRILQESGLTFIVAEGMKDAAEKIAKAVA